MKDGYLQRKVMREAEALYKLLKNEDISFDEFREQLWKLDGDLIEAQQMLMDVIAVLYLRNGILDYKKQMMEDASKALGKIINMSNDDVYKLMSVVQGLMPLEK